jgi:hypothetical protein
VSGEQVADEVQVGPLAAGEDVFQVPGAGQARPSVFQLELPATQVAPALGAVEHLDHLLLRPVRPAPALARLPLVHHHLHHSTFFLLQCFLPVGVDVDVVFPFVGDCLIPLLCCLHRCCFFTFGFLFFVGCR